MSLRDRTLDLRWSWVILLLVCLGGHPLRAGSAPANIASSYEELWRPQFHFTPSVNWMNDPNGMVYYQGEYHLFYQYNPFGNKWGHMSWGHAVSRDLVHWEHLPVALIEEDGIMIFSGSAVVDWNNTSALGRDGKPPLIAIYTGHHTGKPLQDQRIAYSNDRGRTWKKYSGNPVLDLGEKDFRDPKVFWHEPTGKWVMAVAWPIHRKVRFYGSSDLKNWSHLSDFGPAGSTTGIWECPDLFPIALSGRGRTDKWLLVVNVGSGAPAGGSGCQYFTGRFDGTHFHPDPQPQGAQWADWGRDFYAAVSWSDIPKRDGRRLWLGWMSNWEYANDVPTSPWRSAMSIPRSLRLRDGEQGLRLLQEPIDELRKLRHHRQRIALKEVSAIADLGALADRTSDTFELEAELDLEKNSELALRIAGKDTEETVLRVDTSVGEARLDRTRSGEVGFHKAFPGVFRSPVRTIDGKLKIRMFVDTSSVEIFFNDGETVITGLVLMKPGQRKLGLEVVRGKVLKGRVSTWELRSAWRGGKVASREP